MGEIQISSSRVTNSIEKRNKFQEEDTIPRKATHLEREERNLKMKDRKKEKQQKEFKERREGKKN